MSNIISRRKPVEEEEGTANSHSPPHSPPNSTPQSPSHSPSHSPPHSPPHSTLHSPRHSPIPEDAPPTQSQYTPRTATPLKSAMATYSSTKKKHVTISPHTSSCVDDDIPPLPHPVDNENSDGHDLTDEEGEGEEPLAITGAGDATSAVPEPSESVSKVTANGSGSGNGGACTDNVRVEADEGLGEEAGREPSSVAGEEGDQQDVDVGGVAIGNTNTPDQQEGTLDKMSENAVGSSPSGRFLKFDIEVGRGSFKTVYRGLDTETGVAVAWCELSTHKMTKNDRARFMEEGQMLKILEHRNILGFYDYWEVPEKRKVILVTELMTSGTLKAYMRRLKDVKIKFIRTWGRQILQGLHYLHTSNPPIIHRDLKCDNIFINGTTGLVKIGDLGLATLKVSHVKTVIGTPEFMAPEMYEEHYDESVDVYAFGMCLVEMSTLEYPYQECSNPAQVYKKVTAGIPPLSLEKVRNQALKDIALKCTKQHKEDRYTVQELLENPFFQLADYKIEVLPPDEPLDKRSDNIISLRIEPQRLKLPDMEEGAATAFECTYDLQNDVPEDIAQDLVLQGIISSEDTAEVSKLINKKVAQKREQEGDPAVAAQHTATDEREAQAESVTISSPHVGQQESGSALTTAHSQQESPAVAKVDDAAVSKGEESQLRSPPLDDPPVGPPNGEPEPTPPSSAPPSSSSSPDNPPTTSSEAQQGPAPQPPPALTSQMSDGPEEPTVSRTLSKPGKVVPHLQEEAGGAGEKQKKQRGRAPSRVGKEGKRPLKLLLSGVQGGDLAECQFTSFGQQIKFTFSLQADTPDLLAENLMQAGHLSRDQKDEFCTLARGVIQQAKEAQTDTAKPLFVLVEEGASERQEMVTTFTAVDSSAALVQAMDKSDTSEPDQAPVVKREGSANSSPPPQDHTVAVGQANAWREAVVSKEDVTFPKEEAPHRAAGVPSKDSTPLTEEGLATKTGGTPPKAGRTPLDDGVVTSKEGGTPPKESGVPPKDDVTPSKEGEPPPKEGGTLPKEGGTPPKEGGTPPKEGGAPPKELQVHYNFPVPLASSQSSTDSSAVSTPSEPVKTVGDSTAESELALSLHPRPLASLIQAPVLDPAQASSSLHMVDSVPVVVVAPPFAQDLQPSHSASVTPALLTSLAPGTVPSTSAPNRAATAQPLDDLMLHQRMSSELFQGVLPPTHPSPYYPHHTWMGPAYHNPYPPTPWTSYLGAYQTQHTLPVQLPPVPLPQAPPSQPVRLPHRGSLPTGQPSAKTFVVETVSEPSSLQSSAKEEVTGLHRPFVVESIPEWELEGSRLATGVEGRMDPPSLASLDEGQVVDDGDLQATREDKSLVGTTEAEVGQVPQKQGLPFDPKEMDGALGAMMYSMLQVLKNPRMAQLVNELERRYSGNTGSSHSSGRQSPKTDQSISSPPQYLQRDEGGTLQAPLNSEPDKELEVLRRAMQEERQKLERQQEERLQEYSRRKASATLIPGVGQSERRAGSPLLSRSERHLKPALEEVSRQGSIHSLQSLVAPTAHQQPPYVASRDSHRTHLSHGQVLATVQYPAFPQGGGHGGPVWQEGATEGVPPHLQSHHRLQPSAALSWGGAPSYPLLPQHGTLPHVSWPTDKQHGSNLHTSWPTENQHGTAPHPSWPTDSQHGTAPHPSWPTDSQHGTAPHPSWPTDSQHGTAPHPSWPTDSQHSTAPHVSWPTDSQHGTAPHPSWPTDSQHGTAPHPSWPTDSQHGTAPHPSWPTDSQHGTAPHASWPTDHFPHVHGKQ